MRHALEVFFRRQRQFLLLLLLLPLLSLTVGLLLPRSYQSTASLLAVRRYNIVDGTWAAKWYDMLGLTNSSPAVAESGMLTELLSSRAFAVQVGDATDLALQLPSDVRSDPTKHDDALFAEISKKIKVAFVGNNLVTISYVNQDPRIAQQVVAATVRSFITASQQLALSAAQQLLDSYQAQVAGFKSSADQANAQLAVYLAQHPDVRASKDKQATDPTYLELSSQALDAAKSLVDMEGQIGLLQLQINTIGSQPDDFFTVQDAATLPTQPQSRLVTLLLATATGQAIALIICTLYVAILMRRDRVAYSAADLRSTLSIPVLLQIPQIPRVSVKHATTAWTLVMTKPPSHLPPSNGDKLVGGRTVR